jgi:ribosome-binding ATPase YchF (GTP1/OBG family)
VQKALEDATPARALGIDEADRRRLAGYSLLTLKPLLLVLNVAEDAVAEPPPAEIASAAAERGLGLIVLPAKVAMDIAQLDPAEQGEFAASLGLAEPARGRFIRAEVMRWQDLVDLGSEAKCREAGKLRVEGRDYVVQDGDVVHLRFNV